MDSRPDIVRILKNIDFLLEHGQFAGTAASYIIEARKFVQEMAASIEQTTATAKAPENEQQETQA